MTSQQSISAILTSVIATARPGDSLQRVRSLMNARKVDSLVVAERQRPVGLVRRVDVNARADTPEATARDIMLKHYPCAVPGTTRAEARRELENLGLDQLPLVNGDGTLIGVIHRDTLGDAMNSANHNDSTGSSSWRGPVHNTRRAFKVRPGMNVYSSDRRKLGLVDCMFLERGQVTGFLVNHGVLGHRHKQMRLDAIDHLEDETVILGLDQSAFLQMPDIDPETD